MPFSSTLPRPFYAMRCRSGTVDGLRPAFQDSGISPSSHEVAASSGLNFEMCDHSRTLFPHAACRVLAIAERLEAGTGGEEGRGAKLYGQPPQSNDAAESPLFQDHKK